MRNYFSLVILSMLIASGSCTTTKSTKIEPQPSNGLDRLYNLMAGEFSSEAQSLQDSTFFNINLVMVPIWEDDPNSKWLYVEQAATETIDRPYRQRVYKVSKISDDVYESRIYEIPRPERFIQGWKNPEVFETINADSLIVRQGCAVYLKENSSSCFSGATRDKECLSSLRGASYATSIVTVCENEIVSWDQGWNSNDEQVWGASRGGYVFKKEEIG